MKPIEPVDILRLGILLTIVSVILLIFIFSSIYTILPNWGYWDSTDPVEPGTSKKLEVGLIWKGHIFVGKILVWEDRNISLSLEDSLGNTVFGPVLANGSYSFVFKAPKGDFYYLCLDNTYSSLGSPNEHRKMIFWQIFYYGNYALFFQISGSILWVSGIVCIGLYFLKLRKRTVLEEIRDMIQ